MDWMAEERFDWTGPRYGNATAMGRYLGSHPDDARFGVAIIEHLVHLLQSPEKVAPAWEHLQAILSVRYPIWPTT